MSGVLDSDIDAGVEAIRILSEEIGPRPPASTEESAAALYIGQELADSGLDPEAEEFPSSRSFGPSYLLTFGLATLAGLFGRGPLRYMAGLLAAVLGLGDSRFAGYGASALTKRRVSRNVHAVIEPAGEAKRTVCVVSHMDSSRSGLMFHPRVTPFLGRLVAGTGIALGLQALDPLIGRGPGKWLILKARVICALAFGLILEREIRGANVPGANDNASGVGACLALARRFSREPLESTRIVVLVTGSEESGVHGMTSFLSSHDTQGWMFVNYDGVSADASLRVLSKEGGPLGSVDADSELLRMALDVGVESPDLAAEPLEHGSGLPYDATPVLVSGGRAISVVNQDRAIPDYHWPTDLFEHVSRPAFRKAVLFGEALLLRIDRS